MTLNGHASVPTARETTESYELDRVGTSPTMPDVEDDHVGSWPLATFRGDAAIRSLSERSGHRSALAPRMVGRE